MKKLFGDLKKGDNVFLVILGPEKWIIRTLKILKAVPEVGSDIKLTFDDEGWSGYYPKNQISARSSMIWSDKEKAFQFALEKAKKERDSLSRKIDGMISMYDEIEKFIKEYDKC